MSWKGGEGQVPCKNLKLPKGGIVFKFTLCAVTVNLLRDSQGAELLSPFRAPEIPVLCPVICVTKLHLIVPWMDWAYQMLDKLRRLLSFKGTETLNDGPLSSRGLRIEFFP